MAMSKSDLVIEWERVQTKTFTNWANSHLAKRGQKIETVLTGLKDGVALINLLEVISDERLTARWNKQGAKPLLKIHHIENVGYALKFIEEHGVKLANIHPEAIVDGNTKLTLGLMWTVILRFAIKGLSEEGLSAKEGLLLWCQRKTKGYRDVDVQDFSMSFQDGLALCALIHKHRPDLIDYDSLQKGDSLKNLNLAFDTARDHLDVPKLLDAEDIVNVPRPDERSVMTYVAQLYNVFSSLDKVEVAGRRVGKYAAFAKSIADMVHEYETRTAALQQETDGKIAEFGPGAPLGDDYNGAKALIADFQQYKRTDRRRFITEQANLVSLFGNIQAKLRTMNRPAYVPPANLAPADVEATMSRLVGAERDRRRALNENLRQLLDRYRLGFAQLANPFHEKLNELQAALASPGATEGDLSAQLDFVSGKKAELEELASQLPSIQDAEAVCLAANIEENEHTDHTYEDLQFEYEQLLRVFEKRVSFIQSQLSAKDSNNVTPQQLEEFKVSFNHFDADKNGKLAKLEFKSCLSGLGVVALDFEGGNKVFEEIFGRVSQGNAEINLQQFLDYMVSISQDTVSPQQLRESFETLASGKDFLTVGDMKTGQLTPDQISYLISAIPPKAGIEGGYDYKAYLATFV